MWTCGWDTSRVGLGPSPRNWGSEVSREELVDRYLDGQLSRRVFIRRLIATGVTTATAISYASLLESQPAAAADADFYLSMEDFAFVPNLAQLTFGQGVLFVNNSRGGFTHSATDSSGMALFDTGLLGVQRAAQVQLPSAGTYSYRCKEPAAVHPRMSGQLAAPLQTSPATGTRSTTFTVRWAPGRLPSGFVVDVQRRAPGSSTWSNWRTGVTTSSSTFRTTVRGTWSFRARLRRSSNGRTSGWSNVGTVRVS